MDHLDGVHRNAKEKIPLIALKYYIDDYPYLMEENSEALRN